MTAIQPYNPLSANNIISCHFAQNPGKGGSPTSAVINKPKSNNKVWLLAGTKIFEIEIN